MLQTERDSPLKKIVGGSAIRLTDRSEFAPNSYRDFQNEGLRGESAAGGSQMLLGVTRPLLRRGIPRSLLRVCKTIATEIVENLLHLGSFVAPIVRPLDG